MAEAINAGTWRCAVHHYLTNETPAAFDPLPEFSESYYLARYPDIAAAVQQGKLRNGYQHFLLYGAAECRTPNPNFDMRYYADHEVVRSALRTGSARDPFTHYLAIGRAQGLPTIAPPEERVTESQAKTLFRRRAASLLPVFGQRPLDFTCTGFPSLTVVMVVHDRFALTLQALASLRNNYAGGLELLLIDSGSTDETRCTENYVKGAKLLRPGMNIGFLHGSNLGMLYASAEAVLLLNNDLELGPGAVNSALCRLMSDPAIGAVGGKVIRTHGVLQEAGCIVWRDGTTMGYMRDASPIAPEANFVRDVDFCSGVFLMLRRSVIQKIGGFDEAFAPAYYEDADLCLRITAAGWRVVYDPSIVIHHLEYGSARNALESEGAIGRNREIFARKHEATLRERPTKHNKALAFARFGGRLPVRVLFIEDLVPLRGLGSGFVRSNDILRTMAALGYHVTIFPVRDLDASPTAVFRDIPEAFEVMHDRALADLRPFLASRPGYYDVIWIARTHNLDRLCEILEDMLRSGQRRPRIILDTEAIASQRAAVRATLDGRGTSFDYQSALRQEFAHVHLCDQVLAVSDHEASTLRELGLSRISVVGHMRELVPTQRPFIERTGMLFVGAIHDLDSPNYDGLCWFIDEVMPLIEQSLGWETRLTIVGYIGEKVSLARFRGHPRVTLRGHVADTAPLYDEHRIFIAPTRFAAGTPYKVYEASSFGLPVVATELLRRQLGWESGVDLLAGESDDAARFAELVVRLYRDPGLWQHLRENAFQRLRSENSREHYVEAIQAVLGASPDACANRARTSQST
ncbi:MAG: glycosyltransferase [Alphaproteobacteria bacterium]|nr:glycosyltransferase [Alphaproteobacteria bacterium]